MDQHLLKILEDLKLIREHVSNGKIRVALSRLDNMILETECAIENKELNGGWKE